MKFSNFIHSYKKLQFCISYAKMPEPGLLNNLMNKYYNYFTFVNKLHIAFLMCR